MNYEWEEKATNWIEVRKETLKGNEELLDRVMFWLDRNYANENDLERDRKNLEAFLSDPYVAPKLAPILEALLSFI